MDSEQETQETEEITTDIPTLHQSLIDKLKAEGSIRSPAVEAAFRAVPRHLFVPGVELEKVYQDVVIPTKYQEEQAISSSSQPTMMAIMLEQLDLQPGHRVMEIGAGTGYNAALMAHIVGETGKIVTIDIDADLVEGAREHLAAAGYDQVEVIHGDGFQGYPDAAPFDRIILTVSAWDIAPAWQQQLAPEGRIVMPLVITGAQASVALESAGDHMQSVSARACDFMPLRGTFTAPRMGKRRILAPDLDAYIDQSVPITPQDFYDMLTGPHYDLPASVRLSVGEFYFGFGMWLALHETGMCAVTARNELANSGIVPHLLGAAGQFCTTNGLVDARRLALWRRAADTPLPEEPDYTSTLDLLVRSYGRDDTLALRLIDQLSEWHAAGRPDIHRINIRVYPFDYKYQPLPGEVILPKKWTQLVIRWD